MIFLTLAGIAVIKATLASHPQPPALEPTFDAVVRPFVPPVPQELATKASAEKAAADAKANTDGDRVMCSLDVADWELAKVVRVLSQQTGVNVIALAASDKKLTVRLTDVKLSDMIRHICAVSGLATLKIGPTYIIATPEQLKAAYPVEWALANPPTIDPMQQVAADVYYCSYISSTQIADTLRKLFEDHKLQVLAGPQQQVPTLTAPDTSGTTGQSSSMIGTDANAGTPPGGSSLAAGRTIVLRGPRPIVDAALRLAHELDRPQPQVSIAVRVDDISNDALKDLGLQWTFSGQDITEHKDLGMGIGRFDRSPLGFSSKIAALESKNVAKLLAQPNISVLDGEKAMILIGTRLNFPQLVGYSNANTPIFDRQEERVGIYLQVSASITPTGEVTLSLYPQVSTISGFLNVNGASYPQISTREAQTTLRVHSGETIVMGGLLQDEEITQMEKVPILSEIPIIGELFKHRKTTKNRSQVIISITPVVLGPTK